ncbi:MAG: GNAT family N-acetyltransferase [Spirochaetales bacterium]|mgnify:CR=1 FL=1|jgi:RimJ/RimL family protein N-acetyltransferase|nr:GNAT family N-acetyltransferase [Spirochaetales bacterium]
MENPVYAIQTDRLLIRAYNPTDAVIVKDAVDASIEHLRPWMPWVQFEPTALDKKIAMLRRWRGQFDLNTDFVYGAFSADNDMLIGSTGLHTRPSGNGLEIGYWIRAGESGRGYATEIAAALCRAAFEIIGVDYLEIHCDPVNTASAHVAEKLGFRDEYTRRVKPGSPTEAGNSEQVWILFRNEYTNPPQKIKFFDALGEPIS